MSSGKVYVDYRIKTSYSIIGLYTATNFITLSALPWVLPGDILKALASAEAIIVEVILIHSSIETVTSYAFIVKIDEMNLLWGISTIKYQLWSMD